MAKIIKHKQSPSDKVGVFIIEQATKLEVVRQRANVDFKSFFTTKLSEDYRYPRSIKHEMTDISGCRVEIISRKNVEQKYAMLHLHGGAYVLGFNDTYRKVARKYLKIKDDLTIYSPLYSLAPKYPYPAALNECVGVYRHMLEKGFKPENIIFTGDSAGGGLCLAMGLYLNDHDIPLPKAMITLSPWTDLAQTGESYKTNLEKDPLFGQGTIPLNIDAYVGDNDVYNPYISPKYGKYDKFCDLLMFVGGYELIKSDTIDVAEKIENSIVHEFEGMFHVFPLAFNKTKASRTAWKIIEEFIHKELT